MRESDKVGSLYKFGSNIKYFILIWKFNILISYYNTIP